jgi:hypothetical protein
MTYFKPDRITVSIVTWSVRITILCAGISVASIALSFALRALALLGGTLVSLIAPVVVAIGSADPLIQLSLSFIAFLAFLGIAVRLYMAIMTALTSQEIGRVVA